MTDITTTRLDEGTSPRRLVDNRTLAVIGGAVAGAGIVALLQLPAVREACGQLLQSEKVQSAGRELAASVVSEVATSLR